MDTIQQPEQELQGIMLGIALELGAILGNRILKGNKDKSHLGPGHKRMKVCKYQVLKWSSFSLDLK